MGTSHTSFCQNSTSKSCTTDDVNRVSVNCSFRLQISMPNSSNVSRMAVKRSDISLRMKNHLNNCKLKSNQFSEATFLSMKSITYLLKCVCSAFGWKMNERFAQFFDIEFNFWSSTPNLWYRWSQSSAWSTDSVTPPGNTTAPGYDDFDGRSNTKTFNDNKISNSKWTHFHFSLQSKGTYFVIGIRVTHFRCTRIFAQYN